MDSRVSSLELLIFLHIEQREENFYYFMKWREEYGYIQRD